MGKNIQQNTTVLNQHSRIIRDAANLPKEVIASYRLLGAEWDKTGQHLVFLNRNVANHQLRVEALTRAYDTAYQRQAEIVLRAEERKADVTDESSQALGRHLQAVREGADAEARIKAEESRRNAVLEEQTRLLRRLQAEEKERIRSQAARRTVNTTPESQTALAVYLRSVRAVSDAEAAAIREEERRNRVLQQQAAIMDRLTREHNELRASISRSAAISRYAAANFTNQTPPPTPPRTATTGGFDFADQQRQIEEFEQAMARAERTGRRSADGILLSWQSMARLFVLQSAHTAVREFLQLMEQSVRTATQWQIKISEIRTITQDQPRTFNEWANSVRRLSDEFGNPILDVTEGLYETISNQVGKGATAVNFMTKALEFSKVTGASTADSVNLLSAALNSFGLSATNTERVAAVFFKTIDKGRLRAEDIANTFGRVGPSAKALGLSLEEVGAALATLTIRGVPPHEAMTLLNNVMKGLISPSKEMREWIHSLGVETGEQAVQVQGFTGVLAALEKQARGSAGEIGQLFHDVRGRRGATIFGGEGLKIFQDNLKAMEGSLNDFRNAFSIAVESPAAQMIKQLNQVKNFVIDDFGVGFIETINNVSHTLSDEGLVGILRTVIDVSKAGLTVYAAYRISTLGIAAATALRNRVETAQAAQQAQLIALSQARTNTLLLELEMVRLLDLAEAARGRGLTELAAQYTQQASTVRDFARTSSTAADALAVQTTRIGRLRSTLTSFGASLVALLSNPTFLLTAGITAAVYFYSKYAEQQERLARSYSEGYEAAVDANRKITEVTEAELTKQGEAFERNLNRQYGSYIDFAAKIERRAQELGERQEEYTKRSTEYAKESVEEYVRAYTNSLSKLESEHQKILENIRKTEEDLDKSRSTFAENEFKRALKLAEHRDRMKNPGARGNPISGDQIALTAAEIDRLRAENDRLARPTGDVRTDSENLDRIQQNRRKIDDLLTGQADRRFQIEEARQRVIEQIADLEAQINARSEERVTRDEGAAIRQERRTRRGPGRFGDLDQKAAQNQAALETQRRGEQDRITEQKLEELRITLQNYDASLRALPQLTDIQQQGIAFQEEENRLLQRKIELQKQAAALVQSEIERQKNAFTGLKVALEEVQRFKLDPKTNFSDPTAVQKQLSTFDDLVGRAQAAGLQDQKVLSDLAKQRIDLENEVQVKIAAARKKAEAEQLAANKKEIQTRVESQKTALSDLQKRATEAAAQVASIIGAVSDGKLKPGALGEASKVLTSGEDFASRRADEIEPILSRLRELMARVTEAQAKQIEGTGTIDPKDLQGMIATFNALGPVLAYWKDVRIGDSTVDRAGREIPAPTVEEIFKRLAESLTSFSKVIEETRVAATERAAQQAALDQIVARSEAIAPELAPKIEAQSKSFEVLNAQTLQLLQSMQTFKAWLDNEARNPTPSGTPLAVPKMALGGPIGTDTMVAAVTPGEFIVNKSATRKFYRQLVSMNRYEDGGVVGWNPNFSRPSFEIPVGNASSLGGVTIGSITIQGGVSPEYDARALGRAIEREQRLGRVNLNRSNEQ